MKSGRRGVADDRPLRWTGPTGHGSREACGPYERRRDPTRLCRVLWGRPLPAVRRDDLEQDDFQAAARLLAGATLAGLFQVDRVAAARVVCGVPAGVPGLPAAPGGARNPGAGSRLRRRRIAGRRGGRRMARTIPLRCRQRDPGRHHGNTLLPRVPVRAGSPCHRGPAGCVVRRDEQGPPGPPSRHSSCRRKRSTTGHVADGTAWVGDRPVFHAAVV
jgi:hypothetical protein